MNIISSTSSQVGVCVCVGGGGGGGGGGGARGVLKPALRDLNPRQAPSLHSGQIHIFVGSLWPSSDSSMNHYGQQINHR